MEKKKGYLATQGSEILENPGSLWGGAEQGLTEAENRDLGDL